MKYAIFSRVFAFPYLVKFFVWEFRKFSYKNSFLSCILCNFYCFAVRLIVSTIPAASISENVELPELFQMWEACVKKLFFVFQSTPKLSWFPYFFSSLIQLSTFSSVSRQTTGSTTVISQ